MTALRDFPVPLPDKMKRLPVDHRGFPVPWFVHFDEKGEPDFRVIGAGKWERAVTERRCWICGDVLGAFKVFVLGPMCVINRVTMEPPCHYECAAFSAKCCPFLAQPRMRRHEDGLPENHVTAGIMLKHNPGATALFVSRLYKPFKVSNGWLINVGVPVRVEWYAEGQPATRAQVLAAVEKGYPFLVEQAKKDGPEGLRVLAEMRAQAEPLWPAELTGRGVEPSTESLALEAHERACNTRFR